jgi:SsrA-binding protein
MSNDEQKQVVKKIAANRKARYDYEIVESLESGIVLKGSEVKSLREGKANLSDAYARVARDEVWVIGMHIAPYKRSTYEKIDPLRDRKLLLHKNEIKRLHRKIHEKGMTLIPLQLYFKNNIAKLELAIARGKHKYDKKAAIAQKDAKRDLEQEQKRIKSNIKNP